MAFDPQPIAQIRNLILGREFATSALLVTVKRPAAEWPRFCERRTQRVFAAPRHVAARIGTRGNRTRRTPQSVVRQLTQTLEKLTARGQPEDVVRARAEALLAYLADVPVAILVANNRARYVDANRHAVALTGYPRAQLMTMQLWDLTPKPSRVLGHRLWRAFLRRGRMAGLYELRRKDGSVLTANYLAIANVLPGVHVSVLVRLAAPKRVRAITRGTATLRHRAIRNPQARSRS